MITMRHRVYEERSTRRQLTPRKVREARRWWRHGSAVAVSVVFAAPLAVMVIGSLRRPGLPPSRTPGLAPGAISLESYGRAFDLVDLARFLQNSILVAVMATSIAVLSSSLAGFVIARAAPATRSMLVALAVIAVVVPPTALLAGRFTIYRQLGLLDTFVPLVAPALYGVNTLGVLIYAWGFRRLPVSLFETAEIEGVEPLAMWRRIAMPLVRPITTAVATLAFVTTWSDFMSPLVFISSTDRFTLPLGLRSLQLVGRQDTAVLLAACVVASAPVLVAFAMAQRRLFDSARGMI